MSKVFSLNEFRPTLLFLGKFLGLYLAGNLLYGLYVTSYGHSSDPVTRFVTTQVAIILHSLNHDIVTIDHPHKATIMMQLNQRNIISVFEGCNGINMVIIYISFILAFGPYIKKIVLFILIGVAIIHVFNLLRISGLFLIALYFPDYLFFTHKYLFTAFIYLVVFMLWLIWVYKFARTKRSD
jgi:exosortase family protein XrtF